MDLLMRGEAHRVAHQQGCSGLRAFSQGEEMALDGSLSAVIALQHGPCAEEDRRWALASAVRTLRREAREGRRLSVLGGNALDRQTDFDEVSRVVAPIALDGRSHGVSRDLNRLRAMPLQMLAATTLGMPADVPSQLERVAAVLPVPPLFVSRIAEEGKSTLRMIHGVVRLLAGLSVGFRDVSGMEWFVDVRTELSNRCRVSIPTQVDLCWAASAEAMFLFVDSGLLAVESLPKHVDLERLVPIVSVWDGTDLELRAPSSALFAEKPLGWAAWQDVRVQGSLTRDSPGGSDWYGVTYATLGPRAKLSSMGLPLDLFCELLQLLLEEADALPPHLPGADDLEVTSMMSLLCERGERQHLKAVLETLPMAQVRRCVHAPDVHDRRPVEWALVADSPECMRDLLEFGAPLNDGTECSMGMPLLCLASWLGAQRCVLALLEAPYRRAQWPRTPLGRSPLMIAAARDRGWVVQQLLADARCELNALDLMGRSALDYAVRWASPSMAWQLRNSGIVASKLEKSIHSSAFPSSTSTFSLSSSSSSPPGGESLPITFEPITVALLRGSCSLVAALEDWREAVLDEGREALHDALASGNRDMVLYLLGHPDQTRRDITEMLQAEDDRGATLFDLAIGASFSVFLELARQYGVRGYGVLVGPQKPWKPIQRDPTVDLFKQASDDDASTRPSYRWDGQLIEKEGEMEWEAKFGRLIWSQQRLFLERQTWTTSRGLETESTTIVLDRTLWTGEKALHYGQGPRPDVYRWLQRHGLQVPSSERVELVRRGRGWLPDDDGEALDGDTSSEPPADWVAQVASCAGRSTEGLAQCLQRGWMNASERVWVRQPHIRSLQQRFEGVTAHREFCAVRIEAAHSAQWAEELVLVGGMLELEGGGDEIFDVDAVHLRSGADRPRPETPLAALMRRKHAAVAFRASVFAFGGCLNHFDLLSSPAADATLLDEPSHFVAQLFTDCAGGFVAYPVDTLGYRPPSTRLHLSATRVGEHIYLYGGALRNRFSSVSDELLRFTPATGELARVETTGDRPPGLFGHVAVAWNASVWLWGGARRALFREDRMVPTDHNLDWYELHLPTLTWTLHPSSGPLPSPCSGVVGALLDSTVYVLVASRSEALRMWTFDLATRLWRPYACRNAHVLGKGVLVADRRSLLYADEEGALWRLDPVASRSPLQCKLRRLARSGDLADMTLAAYDVAQGKERRRRVHRAVLWARLPLCRAELERLPNTLHIGDVASEAVLQAVVDAVYWNGVEWPSSASRAEWASFEAAVRRLAPLACDPVRAALGGVREASSSAYWAAGFRGLVGSERFSDAALGALPVHRCLLAESEFLTAYLRWGHADHELGLAEEDVLSILGHLYAGDLPVERSADAVARLVDVADRLCLERLRDAGEWLLGHLARLQDPTAAAVALQRPLPRAAPYLLDVLLAGHAAIVRAWHARGDRVSGDAADVLLAARRHVSESAQSLARVWMSKAVRALEINAWHRVDRARHVRWAVLGFAAVLSASLASHLPRWLSLYS